MSPVSWKHVAAGVAAAAVPLLAPFPGAMIVGGMVGGALTAWADDEPLSVGIADTLLGGASGFLLGRLLPFLPSASRLGAAAPIAYTALGRALGALGTGVAGTVPPALFNRVGEAIFGHDRPASSARLQVLESALASVQDSGSAEHFRQAIDIALSVSPLPGLSKKIQFQADAFAAVALAYQRVDNALSQTAMRLPSSWVGRSGQAATSAAMTLSYDAGHAGSAFIAVSEALGTWATEVDAARRRDDSAVRTLRDSVHRLGEVVDLAVRRDAVAGCLARIGATKSHEKAAATCAAVIDSHEAGSGANRPKSMGLCSGSMDVHAIFSEPGIDLE